MQDNHHDTAESIRFYEDFDEEQITPYDSEIQKLEEQLAELNTEREVYRWLVFNEVSKWQAAKIVRWSEWDRIFNSLEFSREEKEAFRSLLKEHEKHLLKF